MTALYIILAFSAGFALAIWLCRDEMKRRADELAATRRRLFATARELQDANRHLRGR